MYTKTKLLSALLPGLLLAACSSTGADDHDMAKGSGPDGQVHWLFVQGAQSGQFDGSTLTLEQVAPTVFFSDRPVRVDGHMSTEHFVGQWGAGTNSFAADPPNAVLSVVGVDEPTTAVIELSNPMLDGNTLAFQVAVHDGTLPASFGQASLFIDSMGLSGPTLGMGMNHLVPATQSESRIDVPGNDSYYRGFSPNQADPLNPNLAGGGGSSGYHFADEQAGPPDLANQLYSE